MESWNVGIMECWNHGFRCILSFLKKTFSVFGPNVPFFQYFTIPYSRAQRSTVQGRCIFYLGRAPTLTYPLTTPMGFILATFFEIPDSCTTSTTWEISLYASGSSSAKVDLPVHLT